MTSAAKTQEDVAKAREFLMGLVQNPGEKAQVRAIAAGFFLLYYELTHLCQAIGDSHER